MTTVGPTVPSSLPLLSPSQPANLLTQLQAGQTLTANVERLLPGGEAELRIGASLVKVNTPVSLAPGQILSLKVEITSQGPLFRANQESQQLETIASALRTAIPKQKPLAEVFTQLQQILKEPASQQLPKPLRSAINTLIQQVPNIENLSKPSTLRQALQQSGPQLEAKLFHAALNQQVPNTRQDLKAGFLRVAQQVLYWQSQQGNVTSSTTATTSTNTSTRTAGVELYHALVAAANKSPSLPSNPRPLLPPLPIPVSTAPTDNRLLGGLQQILERILPASLTPQLTQHAHIQTNIANSSASNVTPGQALLRIAAEILNQLESGLARIQHHQLTAVPNDEPIRTLLNVELPLLNNQQFGNIGIRIEQEDAQQQQQDTEHNWRAVVSFNLPILGKVQAIIRVQQEKINTEFRSENEIATELFKEHIDLLQNRLQEIGLKTGEFHFTTGETLFDMNNPSSSGLLHTEA